MGQRPLHDYDQTFAAAFPLAARRSAHGAVAEPLYLRIIRMTKGAGGRLGERLVAYTVNADPSVFGGRLKK
jgi:hypothetical protein